MEIADGIGTYRLLIINHVIPTNTALAESAGSSPLVGVVTRYDDFISSTTHQLAARQPCHPSAILPQKLPNRFAPLEPHK